MTLRKFAVDYSKIKNDGPKVYVLPRDYIRGILYGIDRSISDAADALEKSRARYAPGGLIGQSTLYKLSPKVAALYNIHAAVELIRKLKKENSQSGSTVKTPKVNWFRGYYAHFGLRIRCNSTTKYSVELHLGPIGWQTWRMLLGLGYTPDQDAFWLELDGFICAQAMPVETMDNVSGELFMGVV